MPASTPKIAFNLDTVEKENTKEPFVVAVGAGETVTFTDPRDLDVETLVKIGDNPVLFFRYCLSEEDRAKLNAAKMPGWKANLLAEAFQTHYGLDTAGNGGALLG